MIDIHDQGGGVIILDQVKLDDHRNATECCRRINILKQPRHAGHMAQTTSGVGRLRALIEMGETAVRAIAYASSSLSMIDYNEDGTMMSARAPLLG